MASQTLSKNSTADHLGLVIRWMDEIESQAFNEISAIQQAVVLSLESPAGPHDPEFMVPLLQAIGRITNSAQEDVTELARSVGHEYKDVAHGRRLAIYEALGKREGA